MSLSKLTTVWSSYENLLRTKPVQTKVPSFSLPLSLIIIIISLFLVLSSHSASSQAITSAVTSALSDLISQSLEGKYNM